jgi:hypothetical protein
MSEKEENKIENKVETLLQQEEKTHVIMEWDKKEKRLKTETIQVFDSLKDGTIEIELQISKDPSKTFRIFQLRTIMEGSIQIKRQDFNS